LDLGIVLSAGNCPSRKGRAVSTNADVVKIAIRVCFLTLNRLPQKYNHEL